MDSILKAGSTWRGIATRLARWGAFVTLAPWAAWAATPSAIVIGQSLPISGPMTAFSRQVISGAQAYVGHINATGGIQGRPVQLVTLDDGGDPERHEANLRSLVRDSKAIAFLNCVGDASCLRAAKVATEFDTPLVGPMSGLRALRKTPHQQVIAVRAGYDKEAAVLSLQMRSMGFSRVTLLTDSPNNAEHLAELNAAFKRQAMTLTTLSVTRGNLAQLQAAVQGVSASNPQTLLFDLDAASLDDVATLAPELRAAFPRMLTSMATPSMTNLMALFRENVIGFTTVVPNPEIQSTPLVRE
ncbi:MAG TPA: ABC transporter substrate-binding protein, partial [Rhizobacter sp.]|nr:ABC transporter substrate-binding protein [Rhizobacter sp.]